MEGGGILDVLQLWQNNVFGSKMEFVAKGPKGGFGNFFSNTLGLLGSKAVPQFSGTLAQIVILSTADKQDEWEFKGQEEEDGGREVEGCFVLKLNWSWAPLALPSWIPYQVVHDRLWYVPTWQDDTRGSTPPLPPTVYVVPVHYNYMRGSIRTRVPP